jgi:hypothetical protein
MRDFITQYCIVSIPISLFLVSKSSICIFLVQIITFHLKMLIFKRISLNLNKITITKSMTEFFV